MNLHQRILFVFVCLALTAFPIRAQVPSNFKGDFQTEMRLNGGPAPTAVAIGDVNGDGRPDVVAANSEPPVNSPGSANSVSVMLGNGDGTLRNPTTYPAGDYPIAVALADVNGDGHLDIICADLNLSNLTTEGGISVLLGNGDGTFQTAIHYMGANHFVSIVVGDFNGDGHPDIAASDAVTGEIYILLNKGDGTFEPGVPYAAGSNPYFLVTADLNGDGKSDLAVTDFCDVGGGGVGSIPGTPDPSCLTYAKTVAVLLGRGDGTFLPAKLFPAGTSAYRMVVRDFNGDGKPDLAVSEIPDSFSRGGFAPAGNLAVLLGSGDGTFQAPVSYPINGTVLAAGDFNADGAQDLVTSNSFTGIAELLGTGTGTFDAAVLYGTGSASGIDDIAVGDLNGDGRPDIVISDGSVVGVLLNAGSTKRQLTSISITASPNPVQVLSLPLTPTITTTVASADTSLAGTVTFYIGGQTLFAAASNNGQPDSSNQVICCAGGLPLPLTPGTYPMQAAYSGDTNSQASTSNTVEETLTIIPTSTEVALDSDVDQPIQPLAGHPVSFTVFVGTPGETIAPPPGSDVTATLFDNGSPIFSFELGGTPPPTFELFTSFLFTPGFSPGTHSITARFSGNAYQAPSVSSPLELVVVADLGLTVGTGGQAAASVVAGSTAEYALAIGGEGLGGQTTVSCTGAPSGAACSVAPASLMVSATKSSALNVTVSTQQRASNSPIPPGLPADFAWMAACTLLACILIASSAARGKRIPRIALASFVFACLAIGSCTGSGSGEAGSSATGRSGGSSGTPAGTYQIVITGNSGANTQSVPLQLTVQ